MAKRSAQSSTSEPKLMRFLMNRGVMLTVLIGLILSVLLSFLTSKINRLQLSEPIEQTALSVFSTVIERFTLYSYGLMEVRTAISVQGEARITPQTFKRFAHTLELESSFPGARGFGFVRRVPADQLGLFLQDARQKININFTLKQNNAHDGELYILQYLEPSYLPENRQVLGFDMASEPGRKQAMTLAMVTGQPQITPPVTLMQNTDSDERSFVIFLPLYRNGVIPSTKSERKKQCFGWAYTPLQMSKVLDNLTPDSQLFIFEMSDVTEPANPIHFYTNDHERRIRLNDLNHQLAFSEEKQVLGRKWLFTVTPTNRFIDEHIQFPPPLIFIVGMAFTLLIAVIISMLQLQKQNRAHLIQEKIKLKSIVDSSVDGIIGKTLDGVVISWNLGAEKMFGYSKNEAIGQALKTLIIPDSLHYEEQDILTNVAKGQTIHVFETIRKRKDGSEFQVSTTVSPIWSAEEQVIGAAKIVRDISEQKAAEAKIKELNHSLERQVHERTAELADLNMLFRTVLSAASEFSIIATDLNGIIRLFNRGAEQMLGYTADEVVGKQTPVIFHDATELAERSQALAAEIGRELAPFELFGYRPRLYGADYQEWTYVKKDGTQYPVSLVVTVMNNEKGQLTGYLGIANDISERLKYEGNLKAAKAAADEANSAKSLFLANMSHEIRTPMNAVLGMLQLTLKTNLDARQHNYIEKANRSAQSLLGLLNDILDYSKIESGKLELDQHSFNFNELLSHLADMMAVNMAQKPVELIYDLDMDIYPHVIGDRLRLQQVLINLLSNAIKFTHQGEVILKAERVTENETHITVTLCISDTGIGISETQLQRIFQGFTQAESSITRKYGGTGLGLVISKKILNLMSSDIHVTSELGKGSEFGFTIKLKKDQPPPSTVTELAGNHRICLVNHNAQAGAILQAAFVQSGHSCKVMTDVSVAKGEIIQGNRDQLPYDVVVCDSNLSREQYVPFAQYLAETAALHPRPHFVLTSFLNDDDFDYSAPPAGIAAVIRKPVVIFELFDLLNQLQADSKEAVNAGWIQPKVSHRLAGFNVLLVEDNRINQEVAKVFLMNEGADVVVASNGQEALASVTNPACQYDVVLMDMQMPVMDGITATKVIRRHLRADQLPIVALTANISGDDQQACLEAGMNGYIVKPIDFENAVKTILAVVQPDHVEQSDLRRSDAEETDVAISFERAVQRVAGDVTLYRNMFALFKTSWQTALTVCRDPQTDKSQLLAEFHTLKGTAATLGLDALSSLLAKYEAELKAGRLHVEVDKHVLLRTLMDTAQTSIETIEAHLSAIPEASEQGLPPPAETMIDQLEELEALIAVSNVRAISVCQALLPSFEQSVVQGMGEQLSVALNGLKFDEAHVLLAEIRRHYE